MRQSSQKFNNIVGTVVSGSKCTSRANSLAEKGLNAICMHALIFVCLFVFISERRDDVFKACCIKVSGTVAERFLSLSLITSGLLPCVCGLTNCFDCVVHIYLQL